MDRHEADRACRGVRNLWPRDESEALRYRRQVVESEGFWFWYFTFGRFWVGEVATTEHGQYRREKWWLGHDCGDPSIPDGYALVEWLAPDGRCADHGDVERHGEQLREIVWHRFSDTNGGWAIGEGPIVMPAERFRGHEGDPWCGERFFAETTDQYAWSIGLGGYSDSLLHGIPRERLTAEHPDHARHEAELFGPGEGNLIGGVVVYPSQPPRSHHE